MRPLIRLKEGIRDPVTKQTQSLTWDYLAGQLQVNPSTKHIEGAFRAFSVKDLLESPPSIILSEWPDLRSGLDGVKDRTNYPKFTAISHIWQAGDETSRIAKAEGRPLLVALGSADNPRTHEISWHGLVEAAKAAKVLDCEYIWMDFLCLDQLDRSDDIGGFTDKALQISNMGNIYRNATAVICMPGGVSAVQGSRTVTAWMDRAWTLQEALLSPNTWLYITWRESRPIEYAFKRQEIFKKFDGPPQFVKLVEGTKYLLTLDQALYYSNPGGMADDDAPFVLCLQGKRQPLLIADFPPSTPNATAALTKLLGSGNGICTEAMWSAIFMRTATQPIDVIYSVAGFFDVQLDSYDQSRSPQDAFNEFARKTATLGGAGLGWLTLYGSHGKLERDSSSFLIPKLPQYGSYPEKGRYFGGPMMLRGQYRDYMLTGCEGLPWYMVEDGKWVLASDHVQHKSTPTIDIKFDTDSQPHIICALVLKYAEVDVEPSLGQDNVVTLSTAVKGLRSQGPSSELRRLTSNPDSMGVLVSTSTDGEKHFVSFLQWTTNGWVFLADEPAEVLCDKAIDKLPRRHFVVGQGSQTGIPSWPCDHEHSNCTFNKPLLLSYGVLLLENDDRATNEVVWFGKKGDKPGPEKWQEFKLQFKEVPKYGVKRSLWLVSSASNTPSDKFDNKTMSNVIEHPLELIQFFDNAEARAQTRKGVVERSYFVAVQFREHMIYLKAAVNEEQLKNAQRTKIVVAPYSGPG